MTTVSADIDRLQRRLASDGQRIKLPSSILTDLSRVTRALYRLQGILVNVEKQPFDGSREPWLSKIKQNIYHVEDILDKLENGSFRAQGSSRGWKLAEASDLWSQVVFFFKSNPSVLHCRMVNKMKKIRKSLDHASEDSFIFSLLHHRADAGQSCDHHVLDENAIIGRNSDKENVRALLLSNSEQKICIVPIVGLGGLGKTALAQLIFSDQDERYNFDLRVWINLNMSYDFNSIADTIISEANRTEEGTSQVNDEGEYNPQILMNCLQEVLNDKRCLIVLDGLWSIDEGQLLHLKRMLQSTQNTKIVVTTCSENVAKLMHTVQPYKLGPLSEKNCWTIFSQRVFGFGDNSDFARIGKQIVKSCEGIPGVIHSLSAFMHDKGTSTWNWNHENEELWKLEKQFPLHINMFSSVKRIYFKMPSALKSCLSYLSMFPKGSDIRMENVIRQWAALGILGSTHGSLPVYAQGRKYIQELLSVFFLEEPDKSTDIGTNHASTSKFLNMHNLVHEFARYVTSHDLFILDGERTRSDTPGNQTSRYALLTRCSDESKVSRRFLTSVRAICLKDCRGAKLIEKIFSASKHLRVLDLSRCSFLELPSSICLLTHLKYIDISGSAIQSLPDEMSFVQNLEALDLSGTCIQVLPDFVGTFKKLTYLNLKECQELLHLPSKLDNIKGLQHLNLSCCPAAHQLLQSISGFQELRFLDISSCVELQTLPESFGRLTNLEDLILSKCTRFKKLPESFSELCFLRFLNVSYCSELEEVPASLGRLTSLEVLILSGCSRIQSLPQSFIDIVFLRMLDLSGCVDLQMDLGILPNNLENLNVDGCRKVCAMPGWTVNLPKLHPECLQTCDLHIQQLIEHKQVCPSHSEVEISNELNVHDKTGEAVASQSCQQDGDSECTTKKVDVDSSAHTSLNIPLHGTTSTDSVKERPRTRTFGFEPVLWDLRKYFDSTNVSIIGVCGPGGVGKTTLLNNFNNELRACGRDYQVVIMIEVSNSKTLNRTAIQRTITDRLGLPWDDRETEEARARFLMKALRRKKFVILLDDVWTKFHLEDVGIPTPDSESKSKVILTSRYVDVCYQMGAQQSLIKMEYLEKEAAWELFRSNLSTQAIAAIDSFGPNNVVKEHADAIVQSCGGLPLALKVIGSAVAGLTEPCEWSLAMQATKHNIKDIDGIQEMFLKLKYSYDRLTPTQQQCFLYCTLFPEYGSISKDQLVEYWMAEELIPQDPNRGHRIINRLLSACLLESCGSDSEVKMHHIIRHLGLSLAVQQKIVVKAGMNLQKAPPHREWRTARRISLMYNDIRDLGISPECNDLVSLLVQNNPNLDRMSTTFFQFMYSLKVLDLSHTRITALPLCSTLVKLKFLNLSHTLIERLPEEFWMLRKLRHLDLSVTKELKETLDNCSKLYKLRVLNLFRSNYGIRDVNDLNIDSLTELEFLGITIYAEDVLKKLTNTHLLAKSTRRLCLKHCEHMQSIQVSDFTNMVPLRELYVESCHDLIQLIAGHNKGKTSCLQILTLAKLPSLQIILVGSSPHHFRNLLEITISHCQKLHNITWVLKLDALEKLSICHCNELEQVVQETINKVDNRRGGIDHAIVQRSREIFFEEQEIHGMVEEAYNEHVKNYQNNTENERIKGVHHVDFPKLRAMVLRDLPKLTAICNPREFPYLEIITVEGCPSLRALPLDQTYDCPKLKQICGSYDWWKKLELNGKETIENKYFIPIKDDD